MISVLIPSRGRPNELSHAINSFGLDKNDIEVLVWIDSDDPKLDGYQKHFGGNDKVKLFIKDRVTYLNFHIMLNFLCEQAQFDWFFEFNDDAYMGDIDWFNTLTNFIEDNNLDPINEPLALNIWGQGRKANLFPIVSRKYVEVLGHFSLNTACDDWVRIVADSTGITHHVYGIRPHHRKYGIGDELGDLKDETYDEVEKQRIESGHWRFRTEETQKQLQEDINKIKKFKDKASKTIKYIANKYKLDLKQNSPIEIPNVGRLQMPELFNELGFKVGAEIGVEEGTYLETLCKGMPNAKLYGIDPWEVYPGYRDYKTPETIKVLGTTAQEKLSKYNCELIPKYSMDAINDFEDNSLDFVYIDANHEFRYFAEDLCEWSKKVRSGGIIYGHDYIKTNAPPDRCRNHVVDVLNAYTLAFNIKPWFIIGTKAINEGEIRDKPRSWLFVKR